MADKRVHLITFFATLAACAVVSFVWRDLWKDAPTSFATLMGFVTLYGVAFAVAELLRVKAAAIEAANAAKQASDQVNNLFGVRDAVECQISIENILSIIDDGGTIPLSHISRIGRFYTSQFPELYIDTSSDVRRRVIILESFGGLAPSVRSKNVRRVSMVLSEISNHLSSSVSNKMSAEYRL